MDTGWLWQGIVTNWLFWLIMLTAGLVGAYVKTTGRKWLPIVYHGLLGAGLSGLIMVSMSIQYTLSIENAAKVSTTNIQEKIRVWLENTGFTTQSRPSDNLYFRYTVTAPNNDIPITIIREKLHGHKLSFLTKISASKEDENIIDKLAAEDSGKLKADLIFGAAQAGVYFNMSGAPQQCMLEQSLPITSTLTESEFIKTIQSMERAIIVLNTIYKQDLHGQGLKVLKRSPQ